MNNCTDVLFCRSQDDREKDTASKEALSTSTETAAMISQAIDRELKSEEKLIKATQSKSCARILLLGCSSSGKSTFIKQLKLQHGQGFTKSDRERFSGILLLNLCQGMHEFLQKLSLWQEFIKNPSLQTEIQDLASNANVIWKNIRDQKISNVNQIPAEWVELLRKLASDGCLVRAMEQHIAIDYGEAFEYLFTKRLNNILQSNYEATDEDILNARLATVAVTEYDFAINGHHQTFIDVSGQKSRRLKWIPFFTEVTSVLYFAPIGNYNQYMTEDEDMLIIKDALALWDVLINQTLLKKASFILFLNKIDLFDSKIPKIPLQHYFTGYNGSTNVKDAREYIKKQFIKLVGTGKERPYTHFTFCTDRAQMIVVISAVIDTIQRRALSGMGVQ